MVDADASVDEGPSTLQLDEREMAGAARRLRFDWLTFVTVVVALITVMVVLGVFRGASTMFTRMAVGLIIALALDPLVGRIERRLGVRRGIAVALVALGVIGVVVLITVVLAPRAVAQAQQFQDQLPETLAQMERLPLVGGWLRDQDVPGRLEEWLAGLPDRLNEDTIETTANTLLTGAASVLIVATFVIAVLIDGRYLVGMVRSLLPERRRQQADEIGQVLYDTLGRYFGGSLTVAMLMGLFVLTLGLILSVPLVPLAAVWAMLTSLIPQVGGFLGGSVFVMLAMTEGLTTGLIAAAGFIIYMNLENHVISPAIVGKAVDLTAPTTMIAAFVGGAVGGVPGALVATPLAGTVKSLYFEVRGVPRTNDDGETSAEDGDDAPRSRRLLARLRRLLPGRNELDGV